MNARLNSVPADGTDKRFTGDPRAFLRSPGMMSAFGLLLAVAVLGTHTAPAGATDTPGIYKCKKGSSVFYTEEPAAKNCRRMPLVHVEAVSGELPDFARDKRQAAPEERKTGRPDLQDRLVRAEELKAVAAIRAAHAAEEQALTLRNALLCQRMFTRTYVADIERIPLGDCF